MWLKVLKEIYKNLKLIVFFNYILFSCITEAEAASLAGYQTAILSRPGNAPLTDDDKSQYRIFNDFESLKIKAK